MDEHVTPPDARARNLTRLLRPRSIAVVGASNDPAKAGYHALKALAGFPGTVLAVHPREARVQGHACVPGLAALPSPVDLAILAVPAPLCADLVDEAAASGIGAVWIIAGGFGETGDAGARLQERLRDTCQRTGMRLLGPNTSGFVHPAAGCVACFVPGTERLRAGRVAVVAQSGGVNLTLAMQLDRLGHGVSLAVGLGNAVDVDAADLVDWLADDDQTAAIALHLEGVSQGRRLADAIRRAVARKPVAALVAGRADVGDFARSHTGNLMGSHARTVAGLEQAGAVVVEGTEALAQAAAVLATRRLAPLARPGFGLVTGQAGPGLLIADGLRSAGIDLPVLSAGSQARIETLLPPLTYVKNPVDTGRPGASFAGVVDAVAADPRIDAVLVFALHEPDVLDPVTSLAPLAQRLDKPVLFGSLGLEDDVRPTRAALACAGLPLLESPDRLILAARALAADAQARHRAAQAVAAPPRAPAPAPAAQPPGALDEHGAKDLMARFGVPVAARRLCTSREEAHSAFDALGAPVVAKIATGEILHKTEAGGVHLNLRSHAELDAALDALQAIPLRGARSYLLEAMAAPGVDLIVGGVRDPSWGPCVMVGLGGVLAEALGDTAIGHLPLARPDVDRMLDSLRGRALLDGFRHLPRCDRASIADALQGIAALMEAHPEVQEVEINPLRVYADGALALDALIVAAEAP